MSNKKIAVSYMGLKVGVLLGVIMLFLSFFNLIDLLNGVWLFVISIPFLCWVKIQKVFGNDILSSCFFAVILLGYMGTVGQMVGQGGFKLKRILFLVLLIFINILAYERSLATVSSIDAGVSAILHRIY